MSAWLGHSTAKLTLDTYCHLMGTDADRAALAPVNRALGYGTGTDRPKGQNGEAEEQAEDGG